MPSPTKGPQPSFTRHDIEAWLLAANVRRAALYLHAVGREPSAPCVEAVTGMSELLQEAFEEVRVLSEASREWSHVVRGEAVDLRTHAAQLMERSVTLMARLAQYAPPSPEAIQEAESRMLELFKNGPGRKDEREQ